jgi:ATP-dependent exoDNAse (exonuclease V) beta subunit
MNKNLLIYQASAGSGKTRTLVKEYLILAFTNPGNYKNTLAITFTNKATEEMKSRVIEYLVQLSKAERDIDIEKLGEEIVSELKTRGIQTKNFNLRKTAADVLYGILHDYSNFSISTIDSFCIRIIKSFAKELGLPVGFNLELDSIAVLDELTNQLLDTVGTDEFLTKYIEDYIIYKLDEGYTWNIDKDINTIGKEIFNEQFWQRKLQMKGNDVYESKEQTKLLIDEIRKVKYSFESHLKDTANEISEIIERNNVDTKDLVGGSKTSIINYCDKIHSGDFAEPYKALRKRIEDGQSLFKSDSDYAEKVNKLFYELVIYYDVNIKAYVTSDVVFKTIYNIGVFSDLLNLLNTYRKDNRTILSTDINNFLRILISDDISPFIFEKVGVKLKNFMLDEFQDTSQFQWDNIKPLIVNSLSEKNTSLIVGDVKQSIYRWRNGDMRLLLEGVERDLAGFKDMIQKDTLSVNYRSHKEIVDFNNRFFLRFKNNLASSEKHEGENEYLTKSYEENLLCQKNNGKKNGGYININFFDYVKDSELTTKDFSNQRVVEILKELKEDGYKPKDILVLVRTADNSRDISQVITEEGYDVVSSLSLLVKNSPKVNLILNALRFITDSSDTLARTEMLYNYAKIEKKEVPLKDIFFDSKDFDGTLFQELMPDGFFKENEKPKRLPVLNNLTSYELVEHIIGIFKLNKEADPYLIKFIDEVYKFNSEKDSDAASFLEYWENKKDELSINLPEEANSIRVMTIHKSKGLESKVVIIPYANWGLELDGRKEKIWTSTDKAPFNQASAYYINATQNAADSYFADDYSEASKMTRLDNVNLLYVSFTRPKERLYVNVPAGRIASIANVIKDAVTDEYADTIKDNRLEIGVREIASADESKSDGLETMEYFNSTPYYKKIIIRPSYKKLKVFENEKMKVKTDKGVVVHKLLSYIIKADDVDSALNKGLIEGIINQSEKEGYGKLLSAVINNKETKEWFEDKWEVKPESDILTKDGKVLRPDRVMLKDDTAVLIDYKTGKEEKDHGEQLDEYGAILGQMGYKKVGKYILYINDYNEEITITVKNLKGGK